MPNKTCAADEVNPSEKRPSRRWVKRAFLTLLVLAFVLHFATPVIITQVANQKLPDILGADASIGSIELNLIEGRVGLSDLSIGQPEGFDGGPLVALKGLQAIAPISKAISGDPIVVEAVEVEELSLHLVVNQDGILNASLLAAADPEEAKVEEEPAEPSAPPPLLLKRLDVKSLHVTFEDQKADMLLSVSNFNISLYNLELLPDPDNIPLPLVKLESIDLDSLRLSLGLGTNAAEKVEKEEEVAATEAAPLPGVLLKALNVRDFEFLIQDANTGLDVAVTNFNVTLNNFAVGTVEDAPAHADLNLSARLRGVKSSAPLSLNGRLGPLQSESLPALQLALSFVGFELDTIKPVTKSDAVKTLGEGLDLNALIVIHPGPVLEEQALGGKWQVKTSSDYSLGSDIKGTIAEPDVNIKKLLTQILVGGSIRAVGNVAGNVAEGGMEAVGAVADTGVEAVKGVGKTLKGAVFGLGKTVKGAATLDKDEMLKGLKETTVGSVTNAVNAVSATADTAGSGVMDTVSTTAGADEDTTWVDEINVRAAATVEAGDVWLKETPFPTSSN